MKHLLAVLFLAFGFLFLGCTTTHDLEEFYEDYQDTMYGRLQFLEEEQEPQVSYTSDMKSKLYDMQANYYRPIGWAGWNGSASASIEERVMKLCKAKKATVAIYSYEYTDTRHGGYVIDGFYIPQNVKRYDYDVYLFAKYNENTKDELKEIGFSVKELDSKSRVDLQRNTGVVVNVVYNDSKAFYANLVKNDVIIEINGNPIRNITDYRIYEGEYFGEQHRNLKVVRNTQIIEINY